MILRRPSPRSTPSRDALAGPNVALAAQNVHPEPKGAFTGEIAPGMLAELGCRYAIVGHSERRTLFGESDECVARKARGAARARDPPIVCVGETLARARGRPHVRRCSSASSRAASRASRPTRAEELVIAYEPIWAIGTGRTATPEIAQEAHALRARAAWCKRFGAGAQSMRIQYGGSVKPDNVDDADGACPTSTARWSAARASIPRDSPRIVRFARAKECRDDARS